ncbi:MAG: fibronectin type III domain-containing protein [Steroidobacteraceae bacterium]
MLGALVTGASYPQPGQNVPLVVTVGNTGADAGPYSITALLRNPVNGRVEGNFFTGRDATGSETASGTVAGESDQPVTMYAPITATAADIAVYSPSAGLNVEVYLNGVLAATAPAAVFLAGAAGSGSSLTGGAPGAVQNVQVSAETATGATLSWSPNPSSDNVLYYEVAETNASGNLPSAVAAQQAASGFGFYAILNGQQADDWQIPAADTTAQLTVPASLGGQYAYWFMVRAVNGAGAGPWSRVVEAVGPAQPYQSPVLGNLARVRR